MAVGDQAMFASRLALKEFQPTSVSFSWATDFDVYQNMLIRYVTALRDDSLSEGLLWLGAQQPFLLNHLFRKLSH